MNPPTQSRLLPGNLLVACDLSDASKTVLDYVTALADAFGARITLLHVWELPPFAQAESLEVVVGPDRRTLAEHAREESDAALARLLVGRADVTRKVVLGNAAESIVHEADSGGYDLVVLGTHGKTGMAHVALGSVAEKVLRRCNAPVFVVPTRPSKEAQDP